MLWSTWRAIYGHDGAVPEYHLEALGGQIEAQHVESFSVPGVQMATVPSRHRGEGQGEGETIREPESMIYRSGLARECGGIRGLLFAGKPAPTQVVSIRSNGLLNMKIHPHSDPLPPAGEGDNT